MNENLQIDPFMHIVADQPSPGSFMYGGLLEFLPRSSRLKNTAFSLLLAVCGAATACDGGADGLITAPNKEAFSFPLRVAVRVNGSSAESTFMLHRDGTPQAVSAHDGNNRSPLYLLQRVTDAPPPDAAAEQPSRSNLDSQPVDEVYVCKPPSGTRRAKSWEY